MEIIIIIFNYHFKYYFLDILIKKLLLFILQNLFQFFGIYINYKFKSN